MNTPTIEFKLNEAGDTKSLYVNGQKTNVWFYLPHHKFYNYTSDDAAITQRAEKTAELITAGELTAENWHMWDLCAHLNITLNKVTQIDSPGDWHNKIQSHSTCIALSQEKKTEIINSLLGTRINTQIIKQWHENRLLQNVGIHFSDFGYALYFID